MSLVKTIKSIKKGEQLLITRQLEQWLVTDGNTLGLGQPEQYDLMVRLAKASANNSVRHARFGASSRGSCERQQVYKFLGMPMSGVGYGSELMNIFNDGTFRHIRWQLMGMAAGIFTDVEVPFVLPEWRLSISMDAINDIEEWIFELKGTSASIKDFRTWEDIPYNHVLQSHTYMFATGWDKVLYVAEDKRTQQWKEVLVRRDPRIIQEVKDELNRLNNAIDTQTIPPVQQACRRGKGTEYRDCPFKERCIDHYLDAGDEWPEIDTGTNRAEWPRGVSTSVSVRR